MRFLLAVALFLVSNEFASAQTLQQINGGELASPDFHDHSVNALSTVNYAVTGQAVATQWVSTPGASIIDNYASVLDFPVGQSGYYLQNSNELFAPFAIKAIGESLFEDFSILLGSGLNEYGDFTASYYWETFKDGELVGSGGFTGAKAQRLTLTDAAGFDTLKFNSFIKPFTFDGAEDGTSLFRSATLISDISGRFVSTQAVPGPEAGAGLGALALGGMALYMKRRRKEEATA